METIEERAYLFSKRGATRTQSQILYDEYVEIATEQKEIDDRRYEFFKERLENWCAAWMQDHPQGTMSNKEWINSFHRAINE